MKFIEFIQNYIVNKDLFYYNSDNSNNFFKCFKAFLFICSVLILVPT